MQVLRIKSVKPVIGSWGHSILHHWPIIHSSVPTRTSLLSFFLIQSEKIPFLVSFNSDTNNKKVFFVCEQIEKNLLILSSLLPQSPGLGVLKIVLLLAHHPISHFGSDLFTSWAIFGSFFSVAGPRTNHTDSSPFMEHLYC